MKKKLILCSILVLALSVNIGCQKEDVKDVGSDKNPGFNETIDNEDKDLLGKFESDTIDFSKVDYLSSETQRDEELEKTIIEYLDYDKDEDGDLAYHYNNIDLNADEKDEIFVYLIGQAVSGSGGSTALIVDKENYEVISDFTLVQIPILISQEKTNGWNDIIMQVSGGGAKSAYVKMEFDGERYPSNPSMEAELEENSVVEGIGIFSNVTRENRFEIK